MSDVTVPTLTSMPSRAEAAALGFLARYEGPTLVLYRIHLKVLFAWAADLGLDVLDLTRTHLELYRHHLATERGNAPSTVALSLTTVKSFYRFAEIDGYFERSPAESRGHRTMSFIGKGGKPATVPLPIPVQRAIDAAAGDRTSGPLLLRQDGQQLERRTAYRWIRSLGKRAGIPRLHPHALRHTMVTLALDAGVPLRDVQQAARHADPRMTERYDRQRGNFDRHASHFLAAYVAGAA